MGQCVVLVVNLVVLLQLSLLRMKISLVNYYSLVLFIPSLQLSVQETEAYYLGYINLGMGVANQLVIVQFVYNKFVS